MNDVKLMEKWKLSTDPVLVVDAGVSGLIIV